MAAMLRAYAQHIGELMAAQRQTVGLAKGHRYQSAGGSKSDPRAETSTLAEAGIDKHLADRARQLARGSSSSPDTPRDIRHGGVPSVDGRSRDLGGTP